MLLDIDIFFIQPISILVTLAATSGSFRGFLCEARTDVTDNTTVVGTLAASGTVSMGEPCGSVRM